MVERVDTPPHECGRFSRPAVQAHRATVPAPPGSALRDGSAPPEPVEWREQDGSYPIQPGSLPDETTVAGEYRPSVQGGPGAIHPLAKAKGLSGRCSVRPSTVWISAGKTERLSPSKELLETRLLGTLWMLRLKSPKLIRMPKMPTAAKTIPMTRSYGLARPPLLSQFAPQ